MFNAEDFIYYNYDEYCLNTNNNIYNSINFYVCLNKKENVNHVDTKYKKTIAPALHFELNKFKEEFFNILLENDCLPKQKYPFEENGKVKLSDLKNLLLKKNSKKHFWFGLLFLIMSLFVFFKIYYIIVGCAFLILSLICRLFGIEKKTMEN
jgi:hypothetical protein